MDKKKPASKSAKERQAFLDNIPDEDLAKIQRLTTADERLIGVDEEWLLLAEFAKHFGWEAYKDVRQEYIKTERISMEEMMTLIAAARKIDQTTLYNNARASFIGALATRAKKPGDAFKSLTKNIIKSMKADE